MKRIKYFILPVVFVINLYILFFQSVWLGIQILKNPPVPLGTVISWLLVVIIPWSVYSIFPLKRKMGLERWIRFILKALVFSGAVWGILSRILSGNWTFSFHNNTYFLIWIIFTSILVLVPLFVLVLLTIRKVLYRNKL